MKKSCLYCLWWPLLSICCCRALTLLSGRVIRLPSRRPVRVLRGDDGVPYVYAESLDDALVAQGFLHAQDRLFQLELYKYVAGGRLAEFIGEHGLRNDRIVRLLDIAGFARAQLARISPAERNCSATSTG